jgi:hypothetical protein
LVWDTGRDAAMIPMVVPCQNGSLNPAY